MIFELLCIRALCRLVNTYVALPTIRIVVAEPPASSTPTLTHKQAFCATPTAADTLLYVVRFWGETEVSATPRSEQIRGRQTLERSQPQRGPFRPPAVLRVCGRRRQLPPAPLPPPPRGVHGEAERREIGGSAARERHLERTRAFEPPDRCRPSGDHLFLPLLLV